MRVMVTGCAGLIGSHLVDELLQRGCEVTGVDSLIGGERCNVPDGTDFVHGEAADVAPVGCDVVCHTAALPYEGLSFLSPRLITSSIVDTTMAVAVNAIKVGVKRIVNFTSIARYGKAPLPYTEECIPLPTDPYGAAKLFAEKQLDLVCRQHGVDVVHVAPHNVVGARQKYDDPYRNVVAIMANLMLSGRQPVIYGDGEQTRSFSHVDDVVRTVANAVLRVQPFEGRLYNIGPIGESMSINELAELIAWQLGFKLAPMHVPDRPGECKHAHSDNRRAVEELGFECTIGVRNAVLEAVDYIQKFGPKPFVYHLPVEIPANNVWTSRIL